MRQCGQGFNSLGFVLKISSYSVQTTLSLIKQNEIFQFNEIKLNVDVYSTESLSLLVIILSYVV